MTESAEGVGDLISRFMQLRKRRKWNQARAAAILGVDQKTISNWQKGTGDEDGEGGRRRDHSRTEKLLRDFFERVDEYGVEVVELPPEKVGEVNAVFDFVTGPGILPERLTVDEREQAAEKWIAQYDPPMRAYFEFRFRRWREAQDALVRLENPSHGRTGNGTLPGR